MIIINNKNKMNNNLLSKIKSIIISDLTLGLHSTIEAEKFFVIPDNSEYFELI